MISPSMRRATALLFFHDRGGLRVLFLSQVEKRSHGCAGASRGHEGIVAQRGFPQRRKFWHAYRTTIRGLQFLDPHAPLAQLLEREASVLEAISGPARTRRCP